MDGEEETARHDRGAARGVPEAEGTLAQEAPGGGGGEEEVGGGAEEEDQREDGGGVQVSSRVPSRPCFNCTVPNSFYFMLHVLARNFIF